MVHSYYNSWYSSMFFDFFLTVYIFNIKHDVKKSIKKQLNHQKLFRPAEVISSYLGSYMTVHVYKYANLCKFSYCAEQKLMNTSVGLDRFSTYIPFELRAPAASNPAPIAKISVNDEFNVKSLDIYLFPLTLWEVRDTFHNARHFVSCLVGHRSINKTGLIRSCLPAEGIPGSVSTTSPSFVLVAGTLAWRHQFMRACDVSRTCLNLGALSNLHWQKIAAFHSNTVLNRVRFV